MLYSTEPPETDCDKVAELR